MYLDDLAKAIRKEIPERRLPKEGAEALLRSYAALLRAKGAAVTQSDVHDAWAAWMHERKPTHEDLRPYEQLSASTKEQDRVFAEAIRRAAPATGYSEGTKPEFLEVLFPTQQPATGEVAPQLFELYKVMVESSEALVGRRQGVNTFFLTINGALLTASGVIVQSAGNTRLAGFGILVLALAGALLSGAWRSLISSFGQLNKGKFKVINAIERFLPVAIYAAEWEALGRGEDKRIYRSFTEREIWVPNALIGLHAVTASVALLFALGVITFESPPRTLFWFA